MESTKKFDCWEELSDEELASISGGVDLSASSILGVATVNADKHGLSTLTDGVAGGTKVGVTKDGISYSGYDGIGLTKINAKV
ncbi:bacteriocin [Brasilonema sp. CT11]|nr:bacteriocin [Brasilonema sp. CT11]